MYLSELASYFVLFLASLGAATVLPLQSEWLVVGLLLQDRPWQLVVAVASLGNILGSVVNYLLGLFATEFRDRRWFPVSGEALRRAQTWYHRYGRFSLLLSWMPFIGDPLTIAAGVMREPLRSFLLLVSIAKVGRYLVLAGLTLHWSGAAAV